MDSNHRRLSRRSYRTPAFPPAGNVTCGFIAGGQTSDRVGPSCVRARWRPGDRRVRLLPRPCMTRIMVMTTIPLADVKARLSAVLDQVRDTHERVVITRNGRPEAVILSVADLEALEETLDILATPGALEQIRQAEDEIARGEAIDADELHRLLAERRRSEQTPT
jgi:antitoxin YefM